MSDPFSLLSPHHGGMTAAAHVRQHQQDVVFRAWRQFNIAYPQLYVIDRCHPIPEPILDDGQPLTIERIRAIMGDDIKPMFMPSPDGDNSKAIPTNENYLVKFRDRIVPEALGASSIRFRLSSPKYYHPKEIEFPECKGDEHDEASADLSTNCIVRKSHDCMEQGGFQAC